MGDPTWITTGPELPVPDRRFRWVAATDPVNGPALGGRLEQQLAALYAGNLDYFTLENGDFTNWTEARGPFGRIVSLTAGRRVLEVGCGPAGILRNPGVRSAGYTGCDFPADLMAENSRRFPDARFVPLKVPRRLPFADAAFDLVFSVFVLEHVVFPHLFLDECLRVCAPSGLEGCAAQFRHDGGARDFVHVGNDGDVVGGCAVKTPGDGVALEALVHPGVGIAGHVVNDDMGDPVEVGSEPRPVSGEDQILGVAPEAVRGLDQHEAIDHPGQFAQSCAGRGAGKTLLPLRILQQKRSPGLAPVFGWRSRQNIHVAENILPK